MTDSKDVGQLPFKFNAPLHNSLKHRVADVSVKGFSGARDKANARIYDETSAHVYPLDSVKTSFPNLRLGRIVMSKDALTFAQNDGKTRYGFRFLYNPETLTASQNVGTDFVPDPQSRITFVLQEGLEVISLSLIIVRTPDVIGPTTVSDYTPHISQDDLEEIKKKGTQYDIEYLHRIANGVHTTRSATNTGDIGILLPNPGELFLGPFRSRGALMSLSVKDVQFSMDMIPTVSYVTISFARYLTIAESEFARLKASGIKTVSGNAKTDDSSSSSSGGGGTVPPENPHDGTQYLNRDEVLKLAIDAGWGDTREARKAVNVAFAESSWQYTAVGDLVMQNGKRKRAYGLWQILSDEGDANYQKYSNPTTCAQQAYSMYKSRKWQPWDSSRYKGNKGGWAQMSVDW